MDRVLLIIDDIQYNRQVEMSLRKVGFEVESVNNEFNVNEPMLSFNPDYIIVRGNSSRLSVMNVGKKLKDNTHYNGKVILVFPQGVDIPAEDLFKLRADLILNDPISTLRLVLYLISLTGQDAEFIKEKLLKYAITDPQFRATEQQILRNAGMTIDSEIDILSNVDVNSLVVNSSARAHEAAKKKFDEAKNQEAQTAPEANNSVLLVPLTDQETGPSRAAFKVEPAAGTLGNVHVIKGEKVEPGAAVTTERADDSSLGQAVTKNDAPEGNSTLVFKIPADVDPEAFKLTEDTKQRLIEEINQSTDELELRIDTYNRAIKSVDQDLKRGLKKRQTKKEFNQLHKDLIEERKTDKNLEDNLDKERISFTNALFKK